MPGGTIKTAATWAWNNRSAIAKSLPALYGWFRKSWPWKKRERGILVLGPGGAGKSTLAKLLSGKYDWLLENPGHYDESIGIEKYALKNGPSVEILIPPGQQHRREATWADLHTDIGNGKFRGIILLAAYGYDTLGQISIENHKLYTGNRRTFLKEYLTDRRRDELAVLRELAPHVRVSPGKIWMLTLVAKQDLWWNKNKVVEHYYRDGEYGAEIKKLIASQDSRRFRFESALVSLVISNFNTAKGDCLQRNVAGYDQQLQIESLRRLFQTVNSLKNWESAS